MTAAWFQFNKVSTEAPSFEDLLHMMWVLHTGLQAHYYMQSIVTYLTSASFPRNYSILFKPNRICSIYMYKKKQRWTIKIDNVQVLQLLPEDNGLQHCCSWKYCGKWCSDSQGHLSEVSPWLCEDNLLSGQKKLKESISTINKQATQKRCKITWENAGRLQNAEKICWVRSQPCTWAKLLQRA